MKNLILAFAVAGVAAMPVGAQHPAEHKADPDKKATAGPGSLPSGWKGRPESGDKTLAGVKAAVPDGANHQEEHRANPDKKASAGPGSLPTAGKRRHDSGHKPLAGARGPQRGGGVRFMTGPAGIYYKPADKMTGAYEAHATF